MRRFVSPWPLLALLALGRTATAEEDPLRTEARQLAEQGDAAFATGRCDLAIPLWNQALGKYRAPTILLRIARCQALMGRVVEATSTLETTAAEPVDPTAPKAFLDAKDQAARELAPLRQRIATLRVQVVPGQVSLPYSFDVDGGSRTSASPKEFQLDPGVHQLRVRVGSTRWERAVVMTDGNQQTVRVGLEIESPSLQHRTQRTVGLVLGAVGLGAIATGAVFGLYARHHAQELDNACGSDRKHCPPDQKDNIDQLKTEALTADILIGSGAALLVSGAIVVLTERAPERQSPQIRVVPLAYGAAAVGSF